MKKPRLGPTHDFPRGKLNAQDEGGLTIAIGNEGGNVVIRFGKKIAWVGFPPEEAIQFALSIMKHARFMGSVIICPGGPDAEDMGRRGQSDP